MHPRKYFMVKPIEGVNNIPFAIGLCMTFNNYANRFLEMSRTSAWSAKNQNLGFWCAN